MERPNTVAREWPQSQMGHNESMGVSLTGQKYLEVTAHTVTLASFVLSQGIWVAWAGKCLLRTNSECGTWAWEKSLMLPTFFHYIPQFRKNAAGRKARRLFNSNHQCPSARPAHVLAFGSIPNALLGVEALEPYSTLSEALGAYFKCLHLEPTPSPSLQVAKICKPDVHVKVWNSSRAKLPLAIFEKNIIYRSNSRTADALVHCRAPCHKMAKGLAVEDLTPRDTIPHRWQHLHQTWILRHRLV